MREHGIRHLPVLEDGHLVGLVSERDLRAYESLGGMRSARVRDAMSEPVFAVMPGDPVDDVVRTMSEHKYGSAVVVTNRGIVEGIFTAIDACRALADILARATG